MSLLSENVQEPSFGAFLNMQQMPGVKQAL